VKLLQKGLVFHELSQQVKRLLRIGLGNGFQVERSVITRYAQLQ